MKIESAGITYPAGACDFVREAVNFAIRNLGEMRHVSALELLENHSYSQVTELTGISKATLARTKAEWNLKGL